MFSEVCQRRRDTTRVDHDNYSNSSCKKYSLFRQIVLVVQQIVVCGDYCSPINSDFSLILSGSPFDDTNLRSVQPKRSNFELYAWKWGDTCWSSCGAYTVPYSCVSFRSYRLFLKWSLFGQKSSTATSGCHVALELERS